MVAGDSRGEGESRGTRTRVRAAATQKDLGPSLYTINIRSPRCMNGHMFALEVRISQRSLSLFEILIMYNNVNKRERYLY